MAWLKQHLRDGERVMLCDETEDFAVLGLMGPKVPRLLDTIGAGDLNAIPYFGHAGCVIADVKARSARLSYVGEYGFEITCRRDDARALYEALYQAGARPAGLFAQTAMRIEKRFLAMGHDLDADVTPIEAGLTFAIDNNKPFIGRDAVLRRGEEGSEKTIISIILDNQDAVPLGDEPVLDGGRIIGKTTSAAFGYRIGSPVALALVECASAVEGNTLAIDIAGDHASGRATLKPAFDPQGTRMRTPPLDTTRAA